MRLRITKRAETKTLGASTIARNKSITELQHGVIFRKNVITRSDFGIICPLPIEAYPRSIRPTEHTVSSDAVKTGGKTYRW